MFCPRASLSLQTQAPTMQFCPKPSLQPNSGTKVSVLLGMNWCGSFPLLSITYYVAGPYTIYFKWVLCLPGPR